LIRFYIVLLSAEGAFHNSLGQRPRKRSAKREKGLKARPKCSFETASAGRLHSPDLSIEPRGRRRSQERDIEMLLRISDKDVGNP
jgi:hypothetical protein